MVRKVPFYNFTYLDRIFDGYLKKGINRLLNLDLCHLHLQAGSRHILLERECDFAGRCGESGSSWCRRHWSTGFPGMEQLKWKAGCLKSGMNPILIFWREIWQNTAHFYQDTAAAVKEVDPAAQVGGPSICGIDVDRWLNGFFSYCQENRVPLDFVTRHCYCGGETHEER
jgi:xylan 1,4-beta-xylosidase